ncbi:hypothetical protein N7516_007883 [Penicillium verrucosum]|uniref:uncharacterized protein n=1 Tax=Penicillium verrucosum TaxID=60171 RepID=UPI002545B0DA|nr:uncharacterized protein N7516_007883 [Penicillium verrucosum]KAJ5926110.1 hypothetical protein N7516_007883 [Penicillium verrucosum]
MDIRIALGILEERPPQHGGVGVRSQILTKKAIHTIRKAYYEWNGADIKTDTAAQVCSHLSMNAEATVSAVYR